MTVRPATDNTPTAHRLSVVLQQLSQIVVGKDAPLRLALACLLARGHLLIEDIPGVGKTTLARTLAAALGGTFRRIQFTSDLLPSNIAQLINDNYFGFNFMDPSLNQTQAVYEVALNFYGNDWTDTQDAIEQGLGRNIFFHPQYGALSAYSSIARSNYHAGTLSDYG